MEMTLKPTALESMYSSPSLISRFAIYPTQEQNYSGSTFWFLNDLFKSSAPAQRPQIQQSAAIIEKEKLFPVSAKEQLDLIYSFFGFSCTDLSKILHVSRPTIYAWIDETEPKIENAEKLRYLAQIAFDIAPEPFCPMFYIFVNRPVEHNEKSLLEYLTDDTQPREFIVALASTIYQMSVDRRKRIEDIPKAKHGGKSGTYDSFLDY
jgi:hypothetical protein